MIHSLVVWDFDPIFFSLGSVEIRYYGIMWALSLLGGMLFFDNFCKREGIPQRVSGSFFVYGILATILGARLGHCLFYEPGYYLSHPLEILTGFRDGGLASHGAAVGLLIGLWLCSRRNKLPYIWSLDRVMVPVAIGGAIVRLGNLFNSEIVGRVTDVPWAFKFIRLYTDKPVGQLSPEELAAIPAQHPTQLYEAICYEAIFLVLLWLYYGRDMGRRRPGVMFGVGLVGIFLARFCIEFVKVEQEDFEKGWLLDMGQLLSIPFILLGIYMIYSGFRRAPIVPKKKK